MFLLTSAGALLLTGCGIGNNVDAPVGSDVTGLSGIAHGGPIAVIRATVTLYATTSGGYGATGTTLATTTTHDDGSFTFTSAGTCTAGQQAYVTVSGGLPGSAGANPNYLLMAALGDCSTISASTNIWIDEVTTVAAAYALAPFMTDSAGVIGIGAPAANNAETPACTGTGSSMICNAGGLKHAFLNALNLANSVQTAPAVPTGQAYTVTPSNSKGSVPAALINSLADAVESCVNSTGGAAGSSTPCGRLFTDATSPAGNTPTDTLQALINIAQYPTSNATAIYNLSTPVSYYQPQLSSAPPDLSLAIVYSGLTAGGVTSSFGGTYNIATDISDNVYANFYTSPNQYVSAMSSNGTGIFYNDTGLGSTYTYARVMEPDTLGNLWVTNDASAGGTLLKLSATTGALETNGTFTAATAAAIDGVAIDRNNNVYYTVATSAADNLYTIAAGGTTASSVMAGSTPTAVAETTGSPEYVAIDSSGNLWNTEYVSSNSNTYFLPNTGTISAPVFGTAVTTTESSTVGNLQSVVFDSASHAWVNNESTTLGNTLYELATPPALSATASEPITSSQSGVAVSAYEIFDMSIDGANNIFLPDYHTATSYLWEYLPGISATTFVYLKPCAAPNGATTCNSGTSAGAYAAIYAPEQTVVDSTGSVWVANHTSDSIAQVLGVGTPAWPQLSYGHTGEPQ